MDGVFIKTPKGREEVETKAGGLLPAIRRVLIYIDGKRTTDDMRILPGITDIHQVLRQLEADGYIVPVSSSPAPVVTPEPPAVHASVAADAVVKVALSNTLFRPLPTDNNPTQVQLARNFMVNTLKAFVGAFGVTGLVDRLEHCHNHADLRALFDEWHQAIMTSRQGMREADNLRSKLLEVI